MYRKFKFAMIMYTLKTGIPIEEGDCILKLLQRVFRPDIQYHLLIKTMWILAQLIMKRKKKT